MAKAVKVSPPPLQQRLIGYRRKAAERLAQLNNDSWKMLPDVFSFSC